MDKDTKSILAALSYPIWIVGLVVFLMGDKDKELRYHAAQGFVFGLASFIVLWFVGMILGWMVWMFWGFMQLLWVLWLILAIVYAVKAYKGEHFKVPVAYGLMHKFMKV